jgi:acyl-coenzyme A thioesterase PaaI-like protein
VAPVARPKRARHWQHVPLLDALAVAEIEHVIDGVCFEMLVSGLAQNADGSPHAGAVFTLVDLAAGQMAQRLDPPGPMVTLDAELRMLCFPTHELVRAHATCLHAGRRVVSSAVIVEDGVNDVAHATVTMLRVGPSNANSIRPVP